MTVQSTQFQYTDMDTQHTSVCMITHAHRIGSWQPQESGISFRRVSDNTSYVFSSWTSSKVLQGRWLRELKMSMVTP